MRYQGKVKSRKDPQVDIFSFALGKEEIEALIQVIGDFKRRTPYLTETQIIRSRVTNILSELKKFKQFDNFDRREVSEELS